MLMELNGVETVKKLFIQFGNLCICAEFYIIEYFNCFYDILV